LTPTPTFTPSVTLTASVTPTPTPLITATAPFVPTVTVTPLFSAAKPVDPVPTGDYDLFNILLMGSDIRPVSGDYRTDTLIVVSVNRTTNTVNLLSIPRDLYLYIPGYGYNRINTASFWGDLYKWPGRGEALIADMDLRLAALGRTRPDLPVRVIGWGGSGSDVPGRDTLFNTLLETAGGVNVGVLAPRQGGFDVERVVMTHPQALLRGVSYGATPALRNEAARHRLLRRLYPQGQLTYPEALYGCGVPRAAAAAQALQRSLHDISSAAVRR
jgi:hypothetical protein